MANSACAVSEWSDVTTGYTLQKRHSALYFSLQDKQASSHNEANEAVASSKISKKNCLR